MAELSTTASGDVFVGGVAVVDAGVVGSNSGTSEGSCVHLQDADMGGALAAILLSFSF